MFPQSDLLAWTYRIFTALNFLLADLLLKKADILCLATHNTPEITRKIMCSIFLLPKTHAITISSLGTWESRPRNEIKLEYKKKRASFIKRNLFPNHLYTWNVVLMRVLLKKKIIFDENTWVRSNHFLFTLSNARLIHVFCNFSRFEPFSALVLLNNILF